MESLEKIVKVRLPYDLRSDTPGKNYGIHGLDIWFILKGKKGAVQFLVNFGIYLPHVQKEIHSSGEINGYDVGYHSYYPIYDDQHCFECDLLEGGKCFSDGSFLRAEDWVKEIFSIKGEHPDKRIWEKLEEYYKDKFENNE